MSQTITVREYARLTTTPLNTSSLDYAQIPVTMFDWLCRLSAGYRTQYSPALAEVEDRRTLQLDNYVGVLQSPCGMVLEILPKIMDAETSVGQMRQILKDMIASFIDTPTRESESASLEQFHLPLNEWVIANFLSSVNTLLKRGIRSDYLRTEQSEPFLRGQLDMARQMRQLPGREHQFHLRYDVFSPDRAENRLIVRALKQVIQSTQHPGHWRLATGARTCTDAE